MSSFSKTKQEILIGLVICITIITLYPNDHISLLLSFVWMLYFLYRYGRKFVVDHLDTEIDNIRNNIEILNAKKDELQKKIEDLKNEISISEKDYKNVVEQAKTEAQIFYDKKMLEIDNTIKEIEMKNKAVLQSIEDEYYEMIKRRVTDLIVNNLIIKMNDPKNVKNVTLIGISQAVKKIQGLRVER